MRHSRVQIIIYSALTLLALLPVATLTHGQGIQEEVTVTAEFQPSIPSISKIGLEPPQGETEIKLPEMFYQNIARPIAITLTPENIAPVKLVGEPQKKLYRNYLKAGLGTYKTPLLEFYAGSLRSKEYSVGIHLKHLSSSGKIDDYPITNNSLNLIEIDGQKFLNNHTLSGDLGYRRNVVHHYGFKIGDFDVPDLPNSYSFNDDMLKQRFTRFNGSIGIKSNYKSDDMLNHFARIKGRYVKDLFETSEVGFTLNAGADKMFELLDFTDNESLSLPLDIQYVRYNDSLITQNNTLITLKPSIGASFNEYSLRVGLNLNFKLDTLSKAYLFPFVEGRLQLIENALIANIGITGGIRRQSFDELSDINPFVQSILPLQYTRDKFVFYGGLKGRISSSVDLNVQVKSSFVADAIFFVNDFSSVPYNRFTLVNDDGNVIEIRAEAQYRMADKVNARAYGEYVSWNLDNLKYAYHTPSLKVGADISYELQNKIVTKLNILYRGKQYARIVNSSDAYEDVEIKGFADMSISLEYRYTKVLSAFLNFNNITNTRHFIYYNYPSYRFNVMGGVTYSF